MLSLCVSREPLPLSTDVVALRGHSLWEDFISIGHSLDRSRLNMLLLMLLVWTPTWSQTVSAARPAIAIAPGPSSFTFVDEKGDPSKQMTVYTYLPQRAQAERGTDRLRHARQGQERQGLSRHLDRACR